MKSLLFFIVIFVSQNVSAQAIILNPTNPIDPCINIVLGETLDFERGPDCDADVVLLDINDIEVFRSSDVNFSYTFTESGQFTFYCGAGSGAIAMGAICVQVGAIPTLSEWGVICLGLILLIFGTLTVSQKVKTLELNQSKVYLPG